VDVRRPRDDWHDAIDAWRSRRGGRRIGRGRDRSRGTRRRRMRILPFALPAAALAVAGDALAWLATMYEGAIVAAIALVAAAWILGHLAVIARTKAARGGKRNGDARRLRLSPRHSHSIVPGGLLVMS
jgi:hypothetical protein